MNRLLNLKALLFIFTVSLTHSVFAGNDTETDTNQIILAGHDAVAYFTKGKPVLGSSEFTTVYHDAIYRFSTAGNRDVFKNNPEKYAPAYGGFCAYGATFGKKFEIDGKAFEVVDGKLYVNKNLEVYEAWKKDIPKHLNQANTQWPIIEFVAANEL
jgi:YHS domain-containing protein